MTIRTRSAIILAAALFLVTGPVISFASDGPVQILAVSGSVTFNDSPVKNGDRLNPPGILKTGGGSSVKAYHRDARTITILKSDSAVEMSAPGKTVGAFRLLQGLSRWVVGKISADKPVVITTKTAVMGVRGTEFMAVYNPLLDESEIVSFTGQIEFRRKDKPKEKSLVNAGQWGGVGGRFGQAVGTLLTLPQNVLDHFNTQTELQTTLKGAATSAEFHGHKVPQ